jgi:hypothetical protein
MLLGFFIWYELEIKIINKSFCWFEIHNLNLMNSNLAL